MRLMLHDRCSSMPWDVIDNVVFDVGNVLLTYQPEAILRALLPDNEADYPLLKRHVFQSPYWHMMDHGVVSPEEAFMLMGSSRPALRPLIQRISEGWNDLLMPMDEGMEALKTCKEHGKRCYVLSNYADAPFEHSFQKHPDIFSLFDGIVVSARERLIKPDHAIFHCLIERYRLNPERTLFIDDSSANVEAAMACGLQAVHYDAPGVLSKFIK